MSVCPKDLINRWTYMVLSFPVQFLINSGKMFNYFGSGFPSSNEKSSVSEPFDFGAAPAPT